MNKKGFTLVEVLISISLATILLLTSFWILSNTTKMYQKSNKNVAHLQICTRVLDQISDEIISAQKVGSGSNQGLLILEYPDSAISYDYKNGKVRRRKGASSAYLTDQNDIFYLGFKYSGKLVNIKVDEFTTKAYCRN